MFGNGYRRSEVFSVLEHLRNEESDDIVSIVESKSDLYSDISSAVNDDEWVTSANNGKFWICLKM